VNEAAGEDGFVAWIRGQIPARAGVLVGPGDDTAVLAATARPLLVTTDMLLEGSCFRLAEAGPYRVGRKAMAVNLSDIAAMAGVPRAALLSVGLPRTGPPDLVRELFRGAADLARDFNVAVVGGDTNSHDGGLVISVTLLGDATDRGAVVRSGARPGDRLFVTGPLGGSILGHHLDFVPRVREALALHAAVQIRAMIDISDGLAKDLHRLCGESRCGAVVDPALIPIADAARAVGDGVDPLHHALADGEDFELLFAVAPDDADRLTAAAPVPVYPIGSCIESGIWLRDESGRRPLPPYGYEHNWNHA
jgi:thiamine-monophosphate kinase